MAGTAIEFLSIVVWARRFRWESACACVLGLLIPLLRVTCFCSWRFSLGLWFAESGRERGNERWAGVGYWSPYRQWWPTAFSYPPLSCSSSRSTASSPTPGGKFSPFRLILILPSLSCRSDGLPLRVTEPISIQSWFWNISISLAYSQLPDVWDYWWIWLDTVP